LRPVDELTCYYSRNSGEFVFEAIPGNLIKEVVIYGLNGNIIKKEIFSGQKRFEKINMQDNLNGIYFNLIRLNKNEYKRIVLIKN
jgi:hypothetical protein